MTLTKRDNDLLIWVEKYKAITINQAKSIFFNGVYESAKIRNIKIQPRYLNDGLRPDAFIEFQYENDVYFILLEIDYTHYTSNMKMQLYEMLYNRQELQKECYGTFPIVIITRPHLNCIRYNSNNFDIIYTDLKFSNLDRLLFQ